MSIFFGVILFSFLIFIHELGHFAAAKLFGVQVNEFSLFMGPILWSRQKGETLYSLRLIPFGGFCAMEGEDGDSDSPRAFTAAAWWKRLLILVAGAAMNFIVGVALMVITYLPMNYGVQPIVNELEPFSTAAMGNGLEVGDRILAVDGEKIYVFSDFTMLLELNRTGEAPELKGETHDLLVQRGDRTLMLEGLLMEKSPVTEEDGTVAYRYGISFNTSELDLRGRLGLAWSQTVDTVRLVRLSLQMLARGKVGIQEVSGPVGIVQQMSDVAEASSDWVDALMNMLYFGAFIAINLAVMNLLPVPALDGGRVAGLLITAAAEALLHRKINPKYEAYLHGGGMVLLLALMAVIMFKDIWFLFK